MKAQAPRRARMARIYLARATSANAYMLALKSPPLSPTGKDQEMTARFVHDAERAVSDHLLAANKSAAIRATWSAERAAVVAEKIAAQYGHKPTNAPTMAQEGSPNE